MWHKCAGVISREEATRIFSQAQEQMARLNTVAGRLLLPHHAHAATDVTGFGILGHARNMAANQSASVSFVIDRLVCIRGTPAVDSRVRSFKLLAGLSAETSGGLLVALAPHSAEAYIRDLREQSGCDAWIVGRVVDGDRTARLAEGVEVVEV